MFEFLLIIFTFNLFFSLYLFNTIDIYTTIILPSFIAKFIIKYEKRFYLYFSNYKIIKKINKFDMELNKKFLLFIFRLFIKNIKNIKNNNINSRIIIDNNSDED